MDEPAFDERVSISHSIDEEILATGDRLRTIGQEQILEMSNGDRLFLCHGMAYLDSALDFEFKHYDGLTIYDLPGGDRIITENDQIVLIQRGTIIVHAPGKKTQAQ